jgi:XRE family transcriptional regulator, regulator of sulfur utilization
MNEPSAHLARNLRMLRELRNLTQAQSAKLAGVPRATWAHLESGSGNPTLQVLVGISSALQVTIEELVAPPRATGRLVPVAELRVVNRGGGLIRKMLPDPVPHLEFDRMEIGPSGRIVGTPHTPGTREVLTCERGRIELVVSGEKFTLGEGDVVAFRGDQKHSYSNVGDGTAIGYSIVAMLP